jgi:hypothetical protein
MMPVMMGKREKGRKKTSKSSRNIITYAVMQNFSLLVSSRLDDNVAGKEKKMLAGYV